MGTRRIVNRLARRMSLLAGFCAGATLLAAALALAQESAPGGARGEDRGVFGNISRWVDQQASKINSGFRDASWQVQNFGREAGNAARTTVEGAKDAADAVTRLPAARVFTGREKCQTAPNGAPDCVAAANVMCKAKGFASGKSIDMTTSEVCPAQVYISGRNSGAGCHTETFVSRVLCQ